MTAWTRQTTALLRKELQVEWRARETLPPMVVFCAAVVLLLALAAPGAGISVLKSPPPPGTIALADVLPAFLWITVLFAGSIGFARSFEAEKAGGGLDCLLLVPMDRSAIFVAKGLANLLFIVAVEVVLVPLALALFQVQLGAGWLALVVIALALDVGFAATGTLVAGVASATRSKELMLPILALPLLVPPFLAALELTSDVFSGEGLGSVAGRGWFALLLAYDVIVTTAGIMTFEWVVD